MTLLRKMAEKVRGLLGNRANDPEFDKLSAARLLRQRREYRRRSVD
jgi:hypothetical protein